MQPEHTSSRICKLIVILCAFILVVPAAWTRDTEKVLYSFGSAPDGNSPLSGPLIFDGTGNLYGTTIVGGTYGDGTVFELSPKSGGGWSETVLYSFTGGADGNQPYAGVISDRNGNLYGTTGHGGVNKTGAVFELTPLAGGGWNETVIYSFPPSGGFPQGSLTIDAAGNLYGTTEGSGVVFKLTPAIGGGWTEHDLYQVGGSPAPVILDPAGNLYGTTIQGGDYGYGSAFELTPNPDGSWTETVLHSFNEGSDALPSAGLVLDSNGNLYGACVSSNRTGTVFELSPQAGGGWTETVLHTFGSGSDGAVPYGILVFDAKGNLYGTTGQGGTANGGTVFQLTPRSGGGWTEAVLHRFSGGSDGYLPSSGLVLDNVGNFYGTTSEGGTAGTGTVFEMAQASFPFFSFPLMNRTPYNAKIITVFDHSMTNGYCENGLITAYDGEQGWVGYGKADPVFYRCIKDGKRNPLFAFAQKDHEPFSINGQYVGEAKYGHIYLNYDGHPGFDFQTTDQDPSGKIPVLAAADGTVVCVRVPSNCTDLTPVQYCDEGPGEIKIDHGNGYFSIYLHLSSSLVVANQPVTIGQQIGVSGDTGVCGSPHLHFEVRNGVAGGTCPRPPACVPVDPYGWTGSGTDPYFPRAVNINLWLQSGSQSSTAPR